MSATHERLPRLLGPYVLLEKLGGGTYGATFLARERQGRAPLVIKRLRDEVQHREDLRARLRHEARVAVTIDDPRVVRALDVGVAGEVPYVAMEYVEGWPLAEVLRSSHDTSRNWAPSAVVAVVADILRGLEALHGAVDPTTGKPIEVVHRDLSPNNVMLRANGQPVLIDLGLGRSALHEWETATGLSMGTPGYMAPEQIMRRVVDGRSDLYAVAVLAFELLTLQRYVPSSGDVPKMLRATCDGVFRPPSSIDPVIPESVDRVLERALSVSPGDRWPTATAFREALCDALEPTPDAVARCVPDVLRQVLAVRRASRAVLLLAPLPQTHEPEVRTTVFAQASRRAPTALLENGKVPEPTQLYGTALSDHTALLGRAEPGQPRPQGSEGYDTHIPFVDATVPPRGMEQTPAPWPTDAQAVAPGPTGALGLGRVLAVGLVVLLAGVGVAAAWILLAPPPDAIQVLPVTATAPSDPMPEPEVGTSTAVPPVIAVAGTSSAVPSLEPEPEPSTSPRAAPARADDHRPARPAARPDPTASARAAAPAPSAEPHARIEALIERASAQRRQQPEHVAQLDALITEASGWLGSQDHDRVQAAAERLEKRLAELGP